MATRRAPTAVELSRTSIYTTALTCGVLAALTLQIQLGAAGLDFVGLWRNLLLSEALQLRTAGPWWAIASLAFVVGGASAAALSRFPPPWRRFRLLRWLAGTAIVLLLAHVGHGARAPEAVPAGAHVAATLGALGVAGVMAIAGAYVTARR